MSRVSSKEHLELANNFRDMLANYQKAEDLINIGAYARGSNPKIDAAIAKHYKMLALIRQGENERVEMAKSLAQLKDLFR
jgi:flagellum-specific ATP synthase